MLRTLATGFFSRKAAQRLSRFVPNPVLRTALVAGATLLGPALLRRGMSGGKTPVGRGARRPGLLGRILGR